MVVVLILKEGIVALSISSGHFDLSDSGTVCHVRDHASLDELHQVLRVANAIVEEVVTLLIVGAMLGNVNFGMQ